MSHKTFIRILLALGLVVIYVMQPVTIAHRARMTIAKQNLVTISEDAHDNVAGVGFVHTTSTSNVYSSWTIIDNLLINDDPNAIILITQHGNPGGIVGTPNNRAVEVAYISTEHKWAIANQDQSPMSVGVDYNVLIVTTNPMAFIHTATAPTITSHWTCIDHNLTNDNPDAIVMVTQNHNAGGLGGVYNNHAIGVWYSQVASKWCIFNQDSASMPESADFNVLVATEDLNAYVHTATSSNTVLDTTYTEHFLSKNVPNAVVLLTQNWNPGGIGDTYNDHTVGLWYDFIRNNWGILNQDNALMPEDAAFNVLVATTQSVSLVHTATPGNSFSNTTYLDHPLTNDNSHEIILATQNWNPGGVGDTYNDSSIAAAYAFGLRMWSIKNQDVSELMPEDASFNVLIPGSSMAAFIHIATLANMDSQVTYVDHPLTNENPNALLLVTKNWNPGGSASVNNTHAIGVFYSSTMNKWAVFNQDLEDMQFHAAFNILVVTTNPAVFVHTSTADNSTSNHTCIDHPLSNGNPTALLFVTQNWNPDGVGGTYNDHHIGVFYSNIVNAWCVFNQDAVSMPEGAAFNVLVIVNRIFLPMLLR